jgi:hypothetical protein
MSSIDRFTYEDFQKLLNVGEVFTGKEFNERVMKLNLKLVRLTVESECHNGFQYKTGLNIDHVPFNPFGTCTSGGLYFCDIGDFPVFIRYNDKFCVNIRNVTIPDDAKVYVERNKYKTDKFILSESVKIFENHAYALQTVIYDWRNLKYIDKQTQTSTICLAAITQDNRAVQYIKIEPSI